MPGKWDALEDSVSDEIGAHLSKIQAIQFMNSEKRKLVAEVKALMSRKGYVEFESYSGSLHLSRIGDSCIYEVSAKDKSKLITFRGRTVRVVCVGSGSHWYRTFMAGPIEA